MPLLPWYSQNFNGLIDGELNNQDVYVKNIYPPIIAGGQASVTSDVGKVIDGAKSLSYTAVRGKANFYTRALQAHDNYDISWKWKLYSTSGGTGSFGLWLRQTSSLGSYSFGILVQSSLNRIVVAGNGPLVFYPVASMGTAHTMRVTVDPAYNMAVYLDSVSIFTGISKPVVPDMIYLNSAMAGVSPSANAELIYDTFNFQYVGATAPSVPKAPENVFAIKRNRYTVVSWDRTTHSVVTDTVTRGAGSTDTLSNVNIQSGITVIDTIVGGITRTSGLPVEGIDYNVARATGVITWLGTTKQPDTGTDYKLSYEILLNDVTSYELFNATRVNESDMALKTTVATTDVTGKVDTIYVDTDVDISKVYRIKALVISGPDTFESSLSDRAVAIEGSSQIDSKEEVVDRKLFVLDSSALNEGILA